MSARKAVFTAAIMRRVAHVTLSVASFVGVEVIKCMLATVGHGAMVTVIRIVAIVDVAVKTAVAMEPGPRADEYSAGKPVGPIVAVRGAVIRLVVKITVGTNGGCTYIDGHLGRCEGSTA
jgi:hypothetical protein